MFTPLQTGRLAPIRNYCVKAMMAYFAWSAATTDHEGFS
jgi:hypothetical protein